MRRLLPLIALPVLAFGAVRSDMLVSTEWLAGHLNDPDVVILQISRERAIYDAGHIPNARFVALGEIAITRNGIPNELPDVADLEKVFEKAGVSDNSHVILYTDAAVLPATRAWFTFDYLGHSEHASLLDGGLAKWKAEGRTISKDAPAIAAGHFTPHVHPEVVETMNGVKALPANAKLIDARAPEDFTGSRPNAELSRVGHIPGAENVFWSTTQSKDGALLPEAELRKLYEAVGVTPATPVVTYCNSGMQASESYFTLKYLGYNTKLYDGSLSEWSAAKDTPVVK
jgi:thiosulfate/3-mercaptopyruvate sulfurtransferase